ncbi:MAG TPA: hypothetical protein VGE11_18255 [Pseudonocardia sp.]
MFAGVLMVISGLWAVLVGISALFNDKVYVNTPGYLYEFDITGWGWVHLILGVLVAAVGVGVVQGATWGRMAGVVVAGISLLVNFTFIPHYPVWSILIITVDVIIIWALVAYQGRDAA